MNGKVALLLCFVFFAVGFLSGDYKASASIDKVIQAEMESYKVRIDAIQIMVSNKWAAENCYEPQVNYKRQKPKDKKEKHLIKY